MKIIQSGPNSIRVLWYQNGTFNDHIISRYTVRINNSTKWMEFMETDSISTCKLVSDSINFKKIFFHNY